MEYCNKFHGNCIAINLSILDFKFRRLDTVAVDEGYKSIHIGF